VVCAELGRSLAAGRRPQRSGGQGLHAKAEACPEGAKHGRPEASTKRPEASREQRERRAGERRQALGRGRARWFLYGFRMVLGLRARLISISARAPETVGK